MNKLIRIIALIVVITFSVETCLWAAPAAKDNLRPVRRIEQGPRQQAHGHGEQGPDIAGRVKRARRIWNGIAVTQKQAGPPVQKSLDAEKRDAVNRSIFSLFSEELLLVGTAAIAATIILILLLLLFNYFSPDVILSGNAFLSNLQHLTPFAIIFTLLTTRGTSGERTTAEEGGSGTLFALPAAGLALAGLAFLAANTPIAWGLGFLGAGLAASLIVFLYWRRSHGLISRLWFLIPGTLYILATGILVRQVLSPPAPMRSIPRTRIDYLPADNAKEPLEPVVLEYPTEPVQIDFPKALMANMVTFVVDGGYPSRNYPSPGELCLTVDFATGESFAKRIKLDGNLRRCVVPFSAEKRTVSAIRFKAGYTADTTIKDIRFGYTQYHGPVVSENISDDMRWVDRIRDANDSLQSMKVRAFIDIAVYSDFIDQICIRNSTIKSALDSGASKQEISQALNSGSFGQEIFSEWGIIIDDEEKITPEGKNYIRRLFAGLLRRHLDCLDSMAIVGSFAPLFPECAGRAPTFERIIMVERNNMQWAAAHEIGHRVCGNLVSHEADEWSDLHEFGSEEPEETFAEYYKLWTEDSLKAIELARANGQDDLKVLAIAAKTFTGPGAKEGRGYLRAYKPGGKWHDIDVPFDKNGRPDLLWLKNKLVSKLRAGLRSVSPMVAPKDILHRAHTVTNSIAPGHFDVLQAGLLEFIDTAPAAPVKPKEKLHKTKTAL